MRKVKIVSFFTAGDYQKEAERLAESFARFSLNAYVVQYPAMSWKEAVMRKPAFFLNMLSVHSDYSGILWTDADSEFMKIPDVSIFADADLGIHSWKRTPQGDTEYLTGTMYLANKPLVKSFLEEWVEATKRFDGGHTPEQQSLRLLLETGKWNERLKIVDPGPEWVWIFDDFEDRYNRNVPKELKRQPVVKHYQASRRLKT